MINIVKENENAEIDFPTLDRYKEVYPLVLSNYLREYKDNTEKRFIELQIEHYKTYCDDFLNNPKYSFNKWNLEKFYTSRLLVIEYLELKLKELKLYNANSTEFNLPINKDADDLFYFLAKNYRSQKNTIIKFVNILQYLKYDADKSKYIFNMKQSEYQKRIKEEFNLEIKKFSKSEKYFEVERPILEDKESLFADSRR